MTRAKIKSKVSKHLDSLENQLEEAWIIEYKGRQLRLNSGKSVWKKKQHASSALTNHIDYCEYNFLDMDQRSLPYTERREILKNIKEEFHKQVTIKQIT